MHKLWKALTNRVVLVGIVVVAQLVWLCALFFGLAQYRVWINAMFSLLSMLMVLYLIRKELTPAYKIAWIIVCCTAPVLGGMLYLLFGDKRPGKAMRRRMEQVQRRHLASMAHYSGVEDQLPPRRRALSKHLAAAGPCPIWQDTLTKFYPTGEALFADMLTDMEKARRFIFMEYFIIADGSLWEEIVEILTRKAAQGVDVRILYDDIGSASRCPPNLIREMAARGIRCMNFNPAMPLLDIVMNHRDHRKLTVIDGYIGYTGGINLADEYANRIQRFGYWKDTGLRLEGAAVWNQTVMFLHMWNSFRHTDESFAPFRPDKLHDEMPQGDGLVQPFWDTPLDEELLGESVYMDVLNQAVDYAWLYTPYLIIDHEMQTALCMAAKRGVDVRIGVPGIPDKPMVYRLTKSYFAPLIRAGVKIYTYTPGFLHAKSIVSDDCVAMVGTVNLDYRSLYLHFECGVLLQGGAVIGDIKADCIDTYENHCRRVQLSDCREGFWGSLLDDVLRLFSPML